MFDLTSIIIPVLKVLACFLIVIVTAAISGIIAALLLADATPKDKYDNIEGDDYNDSNKR